MLLEFEIENYKSFKDRIKFSMLPAPKQKGLDYSILKNKIGKKEYKALSCAVVYGPNAAGKTNIIGAMQTFKNIVLRGNIKNDSSINSSNAADYALELIPNNTLPESKNVFFSIKFIHKEVVIKYSISLDLGMFLETEKDRSVVEEVFEINEKELFHRKDDNLLLHNLNYFESNLMSNSKKDFNIIYSITKKSLKKDELFLMNGFRTIVSSDFAELVYDYFTNYFTTIYHADSIAMRPVFDSKSLVDKYINEAAIEFGINSNKLVYVKGKKADLPPVLCSIMPNKKLVPSDLFESYGTVRFVNIFPILAKMLKKGGTLVIDEFDS